MTWIKHIPYDQAKGKLLKLYNRVKGPNNNVDNIMLAHSLRPHTMEGHMALYKNVLHHLSNETPKWFLEVLGVYTSMLNQCAYCVEHHYSGMSRLIDDDSRSVAIRQLLESMCSNRQEKLGSESINSDVFDEKQIEALYYTQSLTLEPAVLAQKNIKKLQDSGWSDGEILEINQVVAYFNYANRTVLGLGVYTEGDVLGLSPNQSDVPNNWNHD